MSQNTDHLRFAHGFKKKRLIVLISMIKLILFTNISLLIVVSR